jgi:dTMP kinase
MQQKKRGKFIVLEGIDGAGTTTVGKAITALLNEQANQPTEFTYEPSAGAIGTLARKYLKHQLVHPGEPALKHLFTADRYEHLKNYIIPKLEEGCNVICDRFIWSTAAYQTVKLDKPVKQCTEDAVLLGTQLTYSLNFNYRTPDATFLLHVSPEIARERRMSRGDQKAELYEEEKIQTYVAASYLEIFQELSKTSTAYLINAHENFDTVVNGVMAIIRSLL